MTEKFFILSTGLTGTHFLGNSLNEFPDICSYHEISPIMGKEGTRYIRWKNNSFQHISIRNSLPFDKYYRWKFKLTRLYEMNRNDGEIFVEANSSLTRILPEVKKAFPDANIIHVVRDPRKFIRSAIDRGWFMDNSMLEGPNPYYTCEMDRSEWFHKTPFQRASWSWLYQNKKIKKFNPNMIVDFKEIFKTDKHRGFLDLIQFINPNINLPDLDRFFQEKDRPTKFHILPEYKNWEKSWKEQIQDSIYYYENEFKN